MTACRMSSSPVPRAITYWMSHRLGRRGPEAVRTRFPLHEVARLPYELGEDADAREREIDARRGAVDVRDEADRPFDFDEVRR